jgi:hypothetical protein
MRYDTKQDTWFADDEEKSIDRHFSRAKVVLSALGLAITLGLALASLVDNIQRRINDLDVALAGAVSDIESCQFDQQPNQLCNRIGSCIDGTSGARREISELRAVVKGNTETLLERGIRISNLEQQVYELKNKTGVRPDPFTGSQGKELEQRIKALETK